MKMFDQILEKKRLLERRKPYSLEVNKEISRLEMTALAASLFRTDGSRLTRYDVEGMLAGEIPPTATLRECVRIGAYERVLSAMRLYRDLSADISDDIIAKLFEALTESDNMVRITSPVIYQWSHTPCHYQDIGRNMAELMRWMASEGRPGTEGRLAGMSAAEAEPDDFVLRAAVFHLDLVSIYPFSEANTEMAWICTYYYLMCRGIGPFFIGMSEQEYNDAVSAFIRTGDTAPMRSALERSIYNTLDQLIQLTE